MIKPGEYRELKIVKLRNQGAYLSEPETESGEEILLPGKQIPDGKAVGDSIRVFVYRDSQDRLIATTEEPLITLHHVAELEVVQLTKIGAFLNWGLEKDLLLPFREQTREVKTGDRILAALYIDKSGRLAATMKLYPYLSQNPPYAIGDIVEGVVYQIADNFGVFVAVEGRYSGMIPKREAQQGFRVGETVKVRVSGIKEDGKLDLSARDKAYLEINTDAEAVMEIIRDEFSGELPFDDKAEPERIREVFGLSKAAFKRAVGHLYRERIVEIKDGRITVL